MAIIIANHRVKDFDEWKPYYDQDSWRREQAGIKELHLGRKADDPNDVYLIWETSDPEKVRLFGDDPELHKLMEKAGVISELKFVILNGDK